MKEKGRLKLSATKEVRETEREMEKEKKGNIKRGTCEMREKKRSERNKE